MSPGASRYRAEQERGSGLTPGPHRVSYVVAVLRGTRRLLLVSGLLWGPMLAWCFAYYVDYAFAAVDPDLVTGVQLNRLRCRRRRWRDAELACHHGAVGQGAPTSVTTAAAPGKIGVQPTLVTVVTRMSPSLSWPASSGLLISRATPWARPGPADGGSNRPPISAG